MKVQNCTFQETLETQSAKSSIEKIMTKIVRWPNNIAKETLGHLIQFRDMLFRGG